MKTRHDFLDERLSDLIGHLYDAAVDERLWTGIAPRIAGAFSATSTVLKLHGDTDVRLLECTENMVLPESHREWAEEWHRKDLWVEKTVAFGLSRIVTDRDLVTPREQRETAYYREWLPALDIFHVVGAAFPAGDGAIGVLGIHRPKAASYFTDADRRKTALFLPHLQRALHLGQRLASVKHAAALDIVDRVDTGAVVVDRSCRVVQINAQAEEILRDRSVFRVVGGRLFLQDPLLHERLSRTVQASIETAAGTPEPPDAVMAVPRRDRLPLTLSATPLRPRGLLAPVRPLALILMRDPERPALAVNCLRNLFGLTRMEAVVAADLGSGRSLEDIARRRGIGLATARAHLKRILSKTGTHRQAEVVALITRSVASVRPK